MKSHVTVFYLVAITLCLSYSSQAGTYYWIGGSGAFSFVQTNKWSTSSGGSPAGVSPGSGDVAVFDLNSGSGICYLTANTTVDQIQLATGYGGQIQLKAFNLTFNNTAVFIGGTITNETFSGTLTGTNTSSVTFQGTFIDCQVSITSKNILFHGSTFSKDVTLTKTSAATTNDFGNGGNKFDGNLTLINSSNKNIEMANSTLDIFNGITTFTNSGTGTLYLANTALNTQYNGQVRLNNTGGGNIYFGNSTPGTSNAATFGTSGNIVVDTNFSTGELKLRNIKYAPYLLNLTLTSTAYITFTNSTFYQNMNVTAAGIQFYQNNIFGNSSASLNTSTSCYFAKTGTHTDICPGPNHFASGTTSIYNSSTAIWNISTSINGDFYYGNVLFTNGGSGILNPAYVATNTFYKNIATNSSTTPIVFAAGGGTANVVLAGSTNQVIDKVINTKNPVFQKLVLNKTSPGAVTLNTPISIGTQLSFTNGILNADNTNFLTFIDNAVVDPVAQPSNSSHINGPVTKIGDDAFAFPTGKNGFVGVIEMTAPASLSLSYSAEYFHQAQTKGSAKAATLDQVSDCEYWTLTGPSNAVTVTLNWTTASCPQYTINSIAQMKVAGWANASSQWSDLSNSSGAVTGTTTSGKVSTQNPINVGGYAAFTLATYLGNILPITLSSFQAAHTKEGAELRWVCASELNNQGFVIERSEDGIDYDSLGYVEGAGTSVVETSYSFIDEANTNSISYYRLKQIDLDSKISYSSVIRYQQAAETFAPFFPNPVKDGILYSKGTREFILYDLRGTPLLRFAKAKSADLSGLPKGIYIIRDAQNNMEKIEIE
jgi:hypothetical protein